MRFSQKIGGEFELKVRVGGTGKAGSLKITEVPISKQRRGLV